ncbi:hypothetical protein YK48G_01290 [Lentilactobacillus fungorum]|uniref:Uncharacterized protein n=1 Tax=Lentilactobacillus fungorum TaxID=2201250 RepID=A0ABQ3VWI2_9LACO|nr:hypothetical protein YK48G_01290 [Lentilactobacillus fungorum]
MRKLAMYLHQLYHIADNMVQEKRTRYWGMEHHGSRKRLDSLARFGVDNDYELANDLGVQTDYLHMVGVMYGYHFKDIC